MLDLYPHNQVAYDNAKFVFETENRTAIVHATGTGKSLIIAKFILENPNSKCLLIAPSIFILKEVKKHVRNNSFKNVDFQTYQFFLFNSVQTFVGYDFIFIDEFHRTGASEWNKQILNLFNLNPQAKILGTSATHIRFLDDERNMTEELFNGNISSFIDLGNSIERGIHLKPKYVSAIYNIREILDDFEYKLNEKKRKKDVENLKSKRVVWEQSNGIDFIINKHLSSQRKKILVFCKSVEHIKFIEELITPILMDFYDNKVQFSTIHSALGFYRTSSIFKSFESSKTPQVLFSVDMLNEGIHVKGVDTIMMFRDTVSPIVFFQQIGRAFTIGQNLPPLIFDFVNNFNITNSTNFILNGFYRDYKENNENNLIKKRNLVIDFFDEVKDIADFVKQFSIKTWDQNFEDVKEFIDNENRLPTKKESEWLFNETFAYFNNKLEASKIEKFNSLFPNFFKKVNYSNFIINFKKYKMCFLEGKIDSSLYVWRKGQRYLYKKNELSDHRFILISTLDPNFFKSELDIWNDKFDQVILFIKQNGRPPMFSENRWFSKQITKLKNGELKNERKSKLEEILDPHQKSHMKIRHSWMEKYKKVKLFYNEYNRFPNSKESLYNWLCDQRHKNKIGKISQTQIHLLLQVDENFFEKKIE